MDSLFGQSVNDSTHRRRRNNDYYLSILEGIFDRSPLFCLINHPVSSKSCLTQTCPIVNTLVAYMVTNFARFWIDSGNSEAK